MNDSPAAFRRFLDNVGADLRMHDGRRCSELELRERIYNEGLGVPVDGYPLSIRFTSLSEEAFAAEKRLFDAHVQSEEDRQELAEDETYKSYGVSTFSRRMIAATRNKLRSAKRNRLV